MEAADAASAAAAAQGEPPVAAAAQPQDPMAMLASMMQTMQAQTQLLTDMVAGGRGAAPAASTTSMTRSLAMSVDTKGVFKCPQYDGQRSGFQAWKKTFYANMEKLDQNCVPILKRIETTLDQKIELRNLSTSEV